MVPTFWSCFIAVLCQARLMWGAPLPKFYIVHDMSLNPDNRTSPSDGADVLGKITREVGLRTLLTAFYNNMLLRLVVHILLMNTRSPSS